MNGTLTAFTLLLVVLAGGCGGQTLVATDKQAGKTDPKAAADPVADTNQASHIYIPKDVNDCFAELERRLSPEDLRQLKESTVQGLAAYHFGLGLWIRNCWLGSESRLRKYFLDLGFTGDSDCLSGTIIYRFWCHLHNQPTIRLEEEAELERYEAKVRQKPTDCTCPEHRVPLKLTYGLYGATIKEGKTLPRWVYLARCSQSSEIWAYEHEPGWYKPERNLLQRIEELERIEELAAQGSENKSKERKSGMLIAPIVDEFEAQGVREYIFPALEEAFPKQ
jgi:hypothetical protein